MSSCNAEPPPPLAPVRAECTASEAAETHADTHTHTQRAHTPAASPVSTPDDDAVRTRCRSAMQAALQPALDTGAAAAMAQLIEAEITHTHPHAYRNIARNCLLALSNNPRLVGALKEGMLRHPRLVQAVADHNVPGLCEELQMCEESHTLTHTGTLVLQAGPRLHVLTFLSAADVCRFACASQACREAGMASIVWRALCERDFSDRVCAHADVCGRIAERIKEAMQQQQERAVCAAIESCAADESTAQPSDGSDARQDSPASASSSDAPASLSCFREPALPLLPGAGCAAGRRRRRSAVWPDAAKVPSASVRARVHEAPNPYGDDALAAEAEDILVYHTGALKRARLDWWELSAKVMQDASIDTAPPNADDSHVANGSATSARVAASTLDRKAGESFQQCYQRLHRARLARVLRALAPKAVCPHCHAQEAEIHHVQRGLAHVRVGWCQHCGAHTVLEMTTGDLPKLDWLGNHA